MRMFSVRLVHSICFANLWSETHFRPFAAVITVIITLVPKQGSLRSEYGIESRFNEAKGDSKKQATPAVYLNRIIGFATFSLALSEKQTTAIKIKIGKIFVACSCYSSQTDEQKYIA